MFVKERSRGGCTKRGKQCMPRSAEDQMESSISACAHARDLERAFAMGIDEHLSAHLSTCDSCRAEWTAMEGVVATAQDLARDLPPEPLSDDHKAELREK